jgi:hypothetical protein
MRQLEARRRGETGIRGRAREMDSKPFALGELLRDLVEGRPEIARRTSGGAQNVQIVPHFLVAVVHRLVKFLEFASHPSGIPLEKHLTASMRRSMPASDWMNPS